MLLMSFWQNAVQCLIVEQQGCFNFEFQSTMKLFILDCSYNSMLKRDSLLHKLVNEEHVKTLKLVGVGISVKLKGGAEYLQWYVTGYLRILK